MDCSTPGLPVHYQLPEFTQILSIKSVMPSSHLILCHPLLLLPPIPLSIRVFSSESTLHVRWPKYWISALASVLTTSLVAQRLKRLRAMRETRVQSLGWEDPLEKEMATHSSTLAWKIPRTEEPGGPQPRGLQRRKQFSHRTPHTASL